MKLPVSVSNCSEPITLPEQKTSDPAEYFYLYRISYAWTCFLGFLVTVMVGNLGSECVRLVSGTQKEVEPHLLAYIVRREEERKEDVVDDSEPCLTSDF